MTMSTTNEIPSDAVAMFRLPLTVRRMTEICEIYRHGHRVSQLGDWLVVTTREVAP
jgi:hypothetical protein